MLRNNTVVERLMDNATVAFFIMDDRQHCTYMNRAAVELTGYALVEVQGRPLHDVIHHRRPDGTPYPMAECPIDRAFPENDRQQGEDVFVHRDGSFYDVAYTASPLRDGGRPVGTVIEVIGITERKRQERALRESEERFRVLVEAASVAVWEGDVDGRIQRGSRGWAAFTGQSLAAQAGLGWIDAVHPDDRERIRMYWITEAQRSGNYDVVYRLHRADGVYRWTHAIGARLQDEDGRPLKWVGMNLDVTEQIEAERALREADRRKDEFIATLAHELRNPLAPLRNTLEYLKLAQPDDRLRASLAIIDRQVHHMSRLVDDLLDISRLTTGKLTLKRRRVALRTVLEAAIEAIRPVVAAAGHQLAITLDDALGDVDGDPVRLTQVFANLLDNAVKFTPRGGRLELRAEAAPPGRYTVHVQDSGIGLRPQDVERVFSMFSQIAPAGRGNGGLGIGLALARSLVDMHHGVLTATSAGPGAGSTFTVSLPALPAATTHDAPDPVTARGTTGARVLVVDDNLDILESTAMLLSVMGYRVDTAASGEAALARVNGDRPDVVLLDIGMPGQDGYEVCRQLRRVWSPATTRIVAVTGWGQAADRERARAAGFDAHLVKPVRLEDLELALTQR